MSQETSKRRPMGATFLAIVLGWLGVAGILNALAWPLVLNSELMRAATSQFIARFPPALGSWWLSLLTLAYGVTALWAARAIWRLLPSAVASYSVWVATVLLVMVALTVSTPGVSLFAASGFVIVVFALLAGGWLLIRREVQP
jgi:hypothetical protein